jgi:aryl-alcohol dehydrogenase-like predicted oxidoreductase
MDRVALGDTGLEVSRLGLGTVKFGRNQGVKYPEGFELPDDGALRDLLALAQDLGINMLDTAPSYGTSEERLGVLLTPEHFEMSVERSLKRLGTDYIDVLLIHSDGSDMDILSDEAIVEKMLDFKKRGLVRAVGASTKTADGGIKALERMDVIMATHNPHYTDEAPALDYAAAHGKGVLLKKLLSSGHDSDVEAAMRFGLGHACAPSAIVGTINPAHLRANVEAAKAAV